MRMRFLRFLCVSLFLGLALAGGVQASETVTVNSDPGDILMDARYDGSTLNVSGEVPAGCDVVIRLVGAPQAVHLREKGKVFGLLWMNVGTVGFGNVPKIYLVAGSKPFDELGESGATLRVAGLHQSIVQEHAAASKELDAVAELLRLKVKDGLYAESGRKVEVTAQGEKGVFKAALSVPSALSPGEYTLEAVALRDGAVVGSASTTVHARLVGLPEWLSNMAFNNGLLYGILATVIAILSGLAIGLVFQSKGAH